MLATWLPPSAILAAETNVALLSAKPPKSGELVSLSPRERAGVRGKEAHELQPALTCFVMMGGTIWSVGHRLAAEQGSAHWDELDQTRAAGRAWLTLHQDSGAFGNGRRLTHHETCDLPRLALAGGHPALVRLGPDHHSRPRFLDA